MKIYTKTGDKGQTSLFGGKRLPKNHIRIESYGTVDELNAFVGALNDHCKQKETQDLLLWIQHRLFDLGSNLAVDPEKPMDVPLISEQDSERLEKAIDQADQVLPPLRHFILPGGHPSVSAAHLARVVCRRAERNVVALAFNEAVDENIIRFLNRLSDYLFVLGRLLCLENNIEEVKWEKGK